jgi:hypothetical protein
MDFLIVSDKDLKFTRNVWKELLEIKGTPLAMNVAYHPQTNGQVETMNKCLEK